MRDRVCVALGTVVAIGAGAMADQLPGTLNFTNQTATRIQPTVAEDPGNNVKEIEYGDFDKDGDLDVSIAVAGGVFGLRLNKLYRNDGGVFNEVSGTSIIPGFSVLDLSRHAFFRDYDDDGWLDLVIVNDDLAGGGPIKIYMNQHPGDVFSHFTEEGAARGLTFEASCGGVSVDVDRDGDYDIYSGNYPGPSQDTLFMNDGNGFFTIATASRVPVDSDYTIDVASGDMNGDGKVDLLISNENDNYYIYYNDKLGAGDDGLGDYKYGAGGTDGVHNQGSSSFGSMEAGDFNNDRRLDLYWSNKNGFSGDRILVNQGNDAAGRATFVEVEPPPYTTGGQGNKITVGDLNGDQRNDVLVAMTGGRPAILRNTTVNGVVSFVDWSPGSAFGPGATHASNHGAFFDTNGDGDKDIFLGGVNDDHLFENVPANEIDEADLGGSGGTLPALYNADPVAVLGRSMENDVDEYTVNGVGSNSFISVVLNGPDDYRVEILNSIGVVIGSSDRGGAGIEEALQVALPGAGTYRVRVTNLDCFDAADLDDDCSITVDDLLGLINNWGNSGAGDLDGNNVVNVDDLLTLINRWGVVNNEYILEVLSRSNL